jgi:hypothetical protein
LGVADNAAGGVFDDLGMTRDGERLIGFLSEVMAAAMPQEGPTQVAQGALKQGSLHGLARVYDK